MGTRAEEMTEAAARAVDAIKRDLGGEDLRFVVIVTNPGRDWVGMSSNADLVDVRAILVAATKAAECEPLPTRIDHKIADVKSRTAKCGVFLFVSEWRTTVDAQVTCPGCRS
jgi:hypothetical protein